MMSGKVMGKALFLATLWIAILYANNVEPPYLLFAFGASIFVLLEETKAIAKWFKTCLFERS
ncbi:hypothetical protein [uncultured Tateyamaria sp.]|uniref:hypothetical protein n=1 Tax=uncultured Tateyamaria sp. TaxID=455651 RepID=UPI00262CFB30|nr:hypothetical protein [uncultured Tateyamaria sp.]